MGRVSMPQGRGSQLHNRRDYEKIGKPIPDNIDVSRTPENITLVDKDIRQAYGEIFGKALAEYNDKQKRADRKIEDYYEHIKKSKNGEKLFYEDVVQWGKAEDFKAPEMREKAKEALKEYAEGFQERNPNLKLIGAYIHMDEASPHLHLDYIPVATGYSRGLAIRNSLDKAIKQQGIIPEEENRKNNATKLWKDNERAVFGEICRSFGLEVEPERKSKRKNLSVDEYKEARDEMLAEISQELQKATQELSEAQDKVKDLEEQLEAREGTIAKIGTVEDIDAKAKISKPLFSDSEIVKLRKDDYDQLVSCAKGGILIKDKADMYERKYKYTEAQQGYLQERYDRLHERYEEKDKAHKELQQKKEASIFENIPLFGKLFKLIRELKQSIRDDLIKDWIKQVEKQIEREKDAIQKVKDKEYER